MLVLNSGLNTRSPLSSNLCDGGFLNDSDDVKIEGGVAYV